MNIKNIKQKGFTLIELVMVIVILGILAAAALPKFVDLKTEAVTSAVAGVAGAISAADGVNVATRAVSTTKGTQVVAAAACATIAPSILSGAVPSTVTVTGTVPSCTVTSVGVTPAITASATISLTPQ